MNPKKWVWPVASVILFVLLTGSISATDFNILLINQSPSEQLASPPVGTVLIDGGYEHGLDVDMSGVIWEHQGFEKGGRRVGSVSVISASAREATCSVTMESSNPVISTLFLVSIRTVQLQPAALLERGMKALDQADFERAMFHFEELHRTDENNQFVKQQLAMCQHAIDSAKVAGLLESDGQREMQRLPYFLEIAHRYVKLEQFDMADEYLNILKRIDSSNAQVKTLQMLIPAGQHERLLHADCFPLPAFNDTVKTDVPAVVVTQKAPDYYPPSLLHVKNKVAQVMALIDRNGHPLNVRLLLSTGDELTDGYLVRAGYLSTFHPATQDGDPVCSWFQYEVILPEPPLDSLLTAHILESSTSLPRKDGKIEVEYFFRFLREDIDRWINLFDLNMSRLALQRKVDSILFHNFPLAFESKYWKRQKDIPSYFKEWRKNR